MSLALKHLGRLNSGEVEADARRLASAALSLASLCIVGKGISICPGLQYLGFLMFRHKIHPWSPGCFLSQCLRIGEILKALKEHPSLGQLYTGTNSLWNFMKWALYDPILWKTCSPDGQLGMEHACPSEGHSLGKDVPKSSSISSCSTDNCKTSAILAENKRIIG